MCMNVHRFLCDLFFDVVVDHRPVFVVDIDKVFKAD